MVDWRHINGRSTNSNYFLMTVLTSYRPSTRLARKKLPTRLSKLNTSWRKSSPGLRYRISTDPRDGKRTLSIAGTSSSFPLVHTYIQTLSQTHRFLLLTSFSLILLPKRIFFLSSQRADRPTRRFVDRFHTWRPWKRFFFCMRYERSSRKAF